MSSINMWIETYYLGLIFVSVLGLVGTSMILFPDRKTIEKIWGIIFVLSAGFIAGELLGATDKAGIPVNINSIAPFQELRIVKKIDHSLSVVKSVDGNDERIVKGIPKHILEGEVFMVREDGTVIVSKSTTPPVTDGVDGEKK